MSDFSTIRGGAFEAAVRTRLGVGEEFYVEVEISGGGEVQIGDYTWDTEPVSITVTATPYQYQNTYGNRNLLMGDVSRWSERVEKRFDDLPSVWEWLTEKED